MLFKALLSLFLFLSSSGLYSKETMLFIDTNNNQHEIRTAKATAARLGKKLVVYPEKNENFSGQRVQEILENTKFDTLIMSGHNGGGNIGGDIEAGKKGGYVSFDMISRYMDKNKYAKENASTLMLLGCFTGNLKEMERWKSLFPNAKIIAGYDGKAPRGTTKMGHDYIREILIKKDKIYQAADEIKLERELKKLKNIYNLDASIYVDGRSCRIGDEYIFRPLRQKNERFKKFDFSECEKKKKEYPALSKLYQKYKDGDISFNSKNREKDLNKINSFLRKNSHCYDFFEGALIGPDESMYMRFWPEVRHNITKHFEKDLTSFFDELNRLENDHDYLNKKAKERIEELNKGLLEYAKYMKNKDDGVSFDIKKLSEDLLLQLKDENERLKEHGQKIMKSLKDFSIKNENDKKAFELLKGQFSTSDIMKFFEAKPEEIKTYFKSTVKMSDDNIAKILGFIKSFRKQGFAEENIGIDYRMREEGLSGSISNYNRIIDNPEEINKVLISQYKDTKEKIQINKEFISGGLKAHKEMFKRIKIRDLKSAKKITRKEASEMAHTTKKLTALLPYDDTFFSPLAKGEKVFSDFYYNLNSGGIPFSWHEIGPTTEPLPQGY